MKFFKNLNSGIEISEALQACIPSRPATPTPILVAFKSTTSFNPSPIPRVVKWGVNYLAKPAINAFS